MTEDTALRIAAALERIADRLERGQPLAAGQFMRHEHVMVPLRASGGGAGGAVATDGARPPRGGGG